MTKRTPFIVVACGILLSACRDDDRARRDEPMTTRATVASAVDDTIRVQSADTGSWGPPFEPVELLRIGGGRGTPTFGDVRDIAVRPGGGAFVFDAKGPSGAVLYAFDASGRLQNTIGRDGNGPGEYSANHVRITALADGTVLIHSAMRTILRYAANGKLLNSFRVVGGGGRAQVLRGANGSFITPVELQAAVDVQPRRDEGGTSSGTARPATASPFGGAAPRAEQLKRYDSTGALVQSMEFSGRWLARSGAPYGLQPFQEWFPLPDGRIVVTRSDKLGFVLTDPEGKQPPLLAQSAAEPVRYHDDERTEWQAALRARREGGHGAGADQDVPRHKHLSESPFLDLDGRIWMSRTLESQKVERYCTFVSDGVCISHSTYRAPPAFVAFTTNGELLGEVRFAPGTGFVRFGGDVAWATRNSESGEQVVVKYRIRR